MNRQTGRAINTLDHLRQSMADILTTPIGSRLMRREYGSQIPDLIDQPLNGATTLLVYAATAMALMRWEPRVRLSQVQLFHGNAKGSATLEVQGVLIDGNEAFNLQVPLRLGAMA